MERGLFLVVEGPEGSGKSTQARLLANRLRAEGQTVVESREPGGTALGEELRPLLLARADLGIVCRAETLLMCAARAQLVDTVIRPALAAGKVVVCDRFGASTVAYQGCGRGLPVDEVEATVQFATGGLQPDLVLLIDVPVGEGLARKWEQQKDQRLEWTRFESEQRSFHERVRAGYLEQARRSPDRWRCIDGRASQESIAETVWQAVRAHLAG